MTVDPSFLAFIGVALLIVVTPGPDMVLVARNTVLGGRRAGAATVLGIIVGLSGWAIAASIGVVAVLQASAVAFTALKLAGAAYLIALGLLTLRGGDPIVAKGAADGRGLAVQRAWQLGLLSASLNPKLGVFFLTLLPQFVEPDVGATERTLGLALVFMVIGICWLLFFVEVTARTRASFDRPWIARTARWATATVLVGLGLRLALARD